MFLLYIYRRGRRIGLSSTTSEAPQETPASAYLVALADNLEFVAACTTTTLLNIFFFHDEASHDLSSTLAHFPVNYPDIPFQCYFQDNIRISTIRAHPAENLDPCPTYLQALLTFLPHMVPWNVLPKQTSLHTFLLLRQPGYQLLALPTSWFVYQECYISVSWGIPSYTPICIFFYINLHFQLSNHRIILAVLLILYPFYSQFTLSKSLSVNLSFSLLFWSHWNQGRVLAEGSPLCVACWVRRIGITCPISSPVLMMALISYPILMMTLMMTFSHPFIHTDTNQRHLSTFKYHSISVSFLFHNLHIPLTNLSFFLFLFDPICVLYDPTQLESGEGVVRRTDRPLSVVSCQYRLHY